MEVKTITRVFTYNGIRLIDPSPGKTPDQVRQIFAFQYPELLNAVIEGPETKNSVSTYKFARAAGAKGVSHVPAMRAIKKGLDLAVKSPIAGASPSTLTENQKCSTFVHAVVSSSTKSTPIQPGPMSFSRYG